MPDQKCNNNYIYDKKQNNLSADCDNKTNWLVTNAIA